MVKRWDRVEVGGENGDGETKEMDEFIWCGKGCDVVGCGCKSSLNGEGDVLDDDARFASSRSARLFRKHRCHPGPLAEHERQRPLPITPSLDHQRPSKPICGRR